MFCLAALEFLKNFQLRLDFDTFTITGPSTLTTSFAKATGNVISAGAAKEISTASRCLTDTFTVTNPSGSSPPAICGTNNGEHSKLRIETKIELFSN